MGAVERAFREDAEEIERLRSALNRIQHVLSPADTADNVETVGRAREIALAALSQ